MYADLSDTSDPNEKWKSQKKTSVYRVREEVYWFFPYTVNKTKVYAVKHNQTHKPCIG